MKWLMGFVIGILAALAECAVVGLIVMLGFKYVHKDVSSVPALGFWACYFGAFAVVTILRSASPSKKGSGE